MDGGGPLEGVTVLELPGCVATRYCGHLLARLGATVLAVGESDDDRRLGPTGPAGEAYGRWLDHGKHRVPSVAGIARPVDLVVAGPDADAVEAGESVVRALTAARPPLLALTWFDLDGPYARWSGSDEVIAALCGLAYSFGDAAGPPTLPQGHEAQVLGGLQACNAALAALLAPADRRPRRIDVDILEAVVCLSEVATVAALDDERARSVRLGVNRFSPTYPCSSYRTADGWVGITCLTPGQWRALCTMIDRPELADERRFATAFKRLVRADEVDEVLAPAFLARTTAEWVAEGDARRIPTAPMRTPGELPSEPHWRDRGSFATFGEGDVLAPTLPFRLRFDGVTTTRSTGTDGSGPLAGVRVVDLSMGWAGPQATRTLGDLGADVVKVESERHPDWYRGWEADRGGDPPPSETRSSFNTLNRSKRGVALELTTPEGLAAAKALVAGADVVIDNFAAGVLEHLGLGPDVQRALRPGVVSVSMPAFGNGGPLSGLRAYGSTVEQASGLPFVNGHEHWPPCLQHVAFGDPVAGAYAVLAVLAALVGRPRRGGADVDLSHVACLFELGADAIIGEQVRGEPPARTGNRRARAVPCCVVPGAGDDAWLAVSVGTEEAWRGLCEVLSAEGWVRDPSLATPEGRAAAADVLEAGIAAWAADLEPADAAAALQHRGVPAAPVQPAHALADDSQLATTGFWQVLDRRHVGRHVTGASPLRFDGSRPVLRRPAPLLGEHTVEVLAEVGVPVPQRAGTQGG